MNMSCDASRSVNYDKLKKLIKEKSVHLIDVREKHELLETGVLPNSVNIPLGEIESALTMPRDEFKIKYNHNKPNSEEKIIFSCRTGGRSGRAMQIALKLGYENVLNYDGGWLDWEAHLKTKSP